MYQILGSIIITQQSICLISTNRNAETSLKYKTSEALAVSLGVAAVTVANISGVKGVSQSNESGETMVKLNDLYSVFKTIKGSPKYWQTAKYELMAKVKQLGPFHLFYTFSCGEMR